MPAFSQVAFRVPKECLQVLVTCMSGGTFFKKLKKGYKGFFIFHFYRVSQGFEWSLKHYNFWIREYFSIGSFFLGSRRLNNFFDVLGMTIPFFNFFTKHHKKRPFRAFLAILAISLGENPCWTRWDAQSAAGRQGNDYGLHIASECAPASEYEV